MTPHPQPSPTNVLPSMNPPNVDAKVVIDEPKTTHTTPHHTSLIDECLSYLGVWLGGKD